MLTLQQIVQRCHPMARYKSDSQDVWTHEWESAAWRSNAACTVPPAIPGLRRSHSRMRWKSACWRCLREFISIAVKLNHFESSIFGHCSNTKHSQPVASHNTHTVLHKATGSSPIAFKTFKNCSVWAARALWPTRAGLLATMSPTFKSIVNTSWPIHVWLL